MSAGTNISSGRENGSHLRLVISGHSSSDGSESDGLVTSANREGAARYLVGTFVENKRFVALPAAIIFEEKSFLLICELWRIVGFGSRIGRGSSSGAKVGRKHIRLHHVTQSVTFRDKSPFCI